MAARVFSGVQSSGALHLGNYIGAIQGWVRMQTEYVKPIFSVVDWHSITAPQNPAALRKNTRDAVISLLACGIDPKKSIIFQQSAVPQHTELAWILGTLTSTGDLNRMTQWKVKAQRHEVPGLGLYTYPVLMAADILLYKATHVPVGDDQDQHLELTRVIARTFNTRFQEDFFPLPKAIYSSAPRVLDLRNPKEKMSKSSRGDNGRINMNDSKNAISHKILKAMTDSAGDVTYDAMHRPAISNLLIIYSALTGSSMATIEKQFKGKTAHELKDALATVVISHLAPIQREMDRLDKDPEYVDGVLRDGAAVARELAETSMREIRSLVGLAAH
eukprot:m.65268 g.65268  ORF g.65268 m.65268 type:complete len:331 (+) comp12591_c0_seq2:27-1019(+)